MIDLHTHILPGVDDGSPALEESVAMARMAAGDGSTDVVASPHADLSHSFDVDLVERRIAELREACGEVVRIHYGCDFHLYFDNVQDALRHPDKYTVNHRRYLLVELSELLALKSTGEALARVLEAGIVPVITHPERNTLLRRRIDVLEQWVRQGCLLQLTAQSLTGGFGGKARAASEAILRRGLAHFVASDAHDTLRRPPCLGEAYALVEGVYGRSLAQRLFEENPGAVLRGDLLAPVSGPEPPRRRQWWRFWKAEGQ